MAPQRKAAHHVAAGERVEVEIPPLPPRDARARADRADDRARGRRTCWCSTSPPAWSCIPAPATREARSPPPSWRTRPAPPASADRGARASCTAWTRTPPGLLVVAKTPLAYESLTAQLLARTVRRVLPRRGLRPPRRRRGGRGPGDRAPPARPHPDGGEAGGPRAARGDALAGARAVRRVHVSGGAPGDRTDAPDPGPSGLPRASGGRRQRLRAAVAAGPLPVAMEGLALHAARLGFLHPATGELVELTSALPARIERLLSHLRHARSP